MLSMQEMQQGGKKVLQKRKYSNQLSKKVYKRSRKEQSQRFAKMKQGTG